MFTYLLGKKRLNLVGCRVAIMASADVLLSSSRSDNGRVLTSSWYKVVVQTVVLTGSWYKIVVQTVVLTSSWYKGWFRSKAVACARC